MQKLFTLLCLSIILIGCSMSLPKNTPVNGDTAVVHYVGTLDDGSEFDSSRKEGRVPLEFVVWQGTMIKGFEAAVVTMEIGEIKKVRLEPSEAYGEEFIEQTQPLSEYKEIITQEVPKNALTGNLEQNVSKEQAESLFWSLEVGAVKNIGEAALKVLSIAQTGETPVMISINDPKAPFYGQVITVWAKALAQDGSEIIVKNIIENKDKEIMVEVDIKPLIEIVKKTETDITFKVKNPHPLAGKALNFEVELLEIKKSVAVAE